MITKQEIENDRSFAKGERERWPFALDVIEELTERVRLIRQRLHQDDPERATVMIDELAHDLGLA